MFNCPTCVVCGKYARHYIISSNGIDLFLCDECNEEYEAFVENAKIRLLNGERLNKDNEEKRK